jgi:hypothetical protein
MANRGIALRAICLALMLGYLPSSSSIWAENHGTLSITVTDAGGAALSDATVEVSSESLVRKRVEFTDERGQALVAGLPPGQHRVAITRTGLQPATYDVELAQGKRVELAVTLHVEPIQETVTVEAPLPIVDPRTPSVSERVSLEQAAALPVGRDYRAFTQLIPGVNVVPNSDGLGPRYEPASKAGNFYHDRGAQLGSRDNTYLLDGFDLTDIGSGAGELVFNANALQEQEVITSLPPAEYSGGAGLVANLVTQEGGPRFAGSLEFFLQTPDMQESYDTSHTRLHTPKDDKWDAGATVGGPILRDRLWFYLAAQRRVDSADVHLSESASPVPRTTQFEFDLRPVNAKLSAAMSARDSLTLFAYRDPRETTGSRDVNAPPNRLGRLEDTFEVGSLSYDRQFGSSVLGEVKLIAYRRSAQSVPPDPSLGPTNTLLFEPGTQVPSYVRNLGSSGGGGETIQRKRQGDASATWFVDGGDTGDHSIKFGFQHRGWEEEVANNPLFDETLTSLAPHLRGITFAQARALEFLPQSELDTILRVLRESPASSAFRTADRDHNGVLEAAELAAMTLASVVGNQGGVNFLRNQILQGGVNNVQQRDRGAFAQDDWRWGAWSVNAGLRAENREYIASDGSTLLDMDVDLFPRIGVAWDVGGRGQERWSVAYGRYSDPLRTSMVRFAGNLTGSIFADQIAIGDEWFTYRVRGQANLPRDAGFAPNLENESETELQLTYGRNVEARTGLLVQLFRREDDNIIEDYDPNLYFNPPAAGEFALKPGDFGYPPSGAGAVNYFLANLVGAKRRTYGADVSLTRSYGSNWSGSFQYSWRDAEGNSNSDGAADLQGDLLVLDPRQPYMWGDLPGTIPHQVKVYGTYRAPFGLEIGGLFYWNSGAVFTESTIFRPTSHGIYYNYQRADGIFARTGDERHPSYWTQDLRLGYPLKVGGGFVIDLFLDVLNIFDSQDAIRVTEGRNNPDFVVYEEPRLLLAPRRYLTGVRAAW